ncbi:MAG: hypothetical protein HZA88_11355 [Verrucomicrobia bacterium]|nr:hypothetical protein [Verrucomicrobiota bacterium]
MLESSGHQPKPLSNEEYQREFQRLVREMEERLEIGDSPREQLLFAMGVIEQEMNGNGGCHWVEEDYADYMDTLRNALTSETSFSAEQLGRIRWALDEILACGRELESVGESDRNATEAIDYLIARVVDWCHLHAAEGQVG